MDGIGSIKWKEWLIDPSIIFSYQILCMAQIIDTKSQLVTGSLFSGGGIGDVGIEWGHNIPLLAACEKVSTRARLIRKNFPKTKVFEGDIWKLQNEYIDFFQQTLKGKRPWLISLSPPCQGMSANGAGRISSSIRAGKRSREDARNRLILPEFKCSRNYNRIGSFWKMSNEWKTQLFEMKTISRKIFYVV